MPPSVTDYRLFHEFAHRFDLHTPPNHYQHDQFFVLNRVRQYTNGRLLDVGCGTGALLRRARADGISAVGIDASPEMVAECERHLGKGAARVLRMEQLSDTAAYDVISCLSWSLNYLPDEVTIRSTLQRFHRALCSGGTVVLQVAHAAHATGDVFEDREPGQDGSPDDVLLIYQFARAAERNHDLRAQYVYACRSERELVCEEHVLHVADAHSLTRLAAEAGFVKIAVYDSWREEPFARSVTPFVVGRKP